MLRMMPPSRCCTCFTWLDGITSPWVRLTTSRVPHQAQTPKPKEENSKSSAIRW